MKKAEMEWHDAEYRALMAAALAAEGKGLYRAAVQTAMSAWEHIDGMMQFESKYENKEFASISAIDTVLKYAPLVLDFRSLNALDKLFESYRRIKRNTSENLAQNLAAARESMWKNHRLWTHLAQSSDVRQDELRQVLGGSQERWRWVIEVWEKMGLVCRTPQGATYRLALSTRMGQVVAGKCPICGHVAEAPKGMFLEQLNCPDCKSKTRFVFLAKRVDANIPG